MASLASEPTPPKLRIKMLHIGDTSGSDGNFKSKLLETCFKESFNPEFVTTIGIDYKVANCLCRPRRKARTRRASLSPGTPRARRGSRVSPLASSGERTPSRSATMCTTRSPLRACVSGVRKSRRCKRLGRPQSPATRSWT